MTLQQLINGVWVDQATVDTRAGNTRCADPKFPNSSNYQLDFTQTGTFIYRWYIPARPGFTSTIDKAFAVLVNEESSPEPSQADVTSALAKALKA